MSFDRLRAMRLFCRIAETGSFTEVARETGMTQPAVTKVMAALEDHLGTRLLNRTTRSVAMTPEGEVYYAEAQRILEAVEESEARVGKRARAPAGPLRVAVPVAFGRLEVAPRLARFLHAHPLVSVDLLMSDRFIDLVEQGVDVAIRVGPLADSALRAKRLGETRRLCVASPAYLKRAGEPATPADLTQHNCLVYTLLSTTNHWRFEGAGGGEEVVVSGNLKADNAEALREAALTGVGIAVSPAWLFNDDISEGRLKVLLEEFEPTRLPVHAVFPSGRYVTSKARAFADFLAKEFKSDNVLSGDV